VANKVALKVTRRGSRIKIGWLHEFFKYSLELTINILFFEKLKNNLIYAKPKKLLIN
jgi:hypothetical protein